uniref:L-serine deaminase n=1 Tax=Gopherus agassizii TaxID=38772 RepID=A0A452GQ46_9SAUR
MRWEGHRLSGLGQGGKRSQPESSPAGQRWERVPRPHSCAGKRRPVQGCRHQGLHETGECPTYWLIQDSGDWLLLSGGGNAGFATVYAAKKLGIPATIIVPTSTPLATVQKMEEQGTEVQVFGKVWDDAYAKALALAETKGWVSIHPFDHPLIWQGHASMVRELKDSLGHKPGAIVLAVGGGGLLAGVVAGLQDVGWRDVPIIAVETKGADSFNAAIKAGRLVTLPEITSVAKCLGAKTVSARALECASECQVISQLVEDVEAVQAVELFLDDERMLVQPACGAPLALLYTGRVQQLQREGHLNPGLDSIVVIVCGGSSIQLAGLWALKTQLGMK